MKRYAVVVKESENNQVQFTYQGREPFITSYKHIAEQHLQYCQENWPNEKYKIVEFDVEI